MPSKMVSIRISEDNYDFLSSLAKEKKRDLSKELRDVLELGRIMLAIKRYKSAEYSLLKSAKIAGMSIIAFMELLKEYGVESNIEFEDYLTGLSSLKRVW